MTLAMQLWAVCPTCGSHFVRSTIRQPSLLFHGGYGEMRVKVIESCGCPVSRVVSVRSESPR